MNYFTIPGLAPFRVLTITQIAECMCDELGIDFDLLRMKDNSEDFVFLRVVFCHCVKLNAIGKVTDEVVSDYLKKNRTMLTHYRKLFPGLYQSKQAFRDLYMKVQNRIVRESFVKKFGFDPLTERNEAISNEARDLSSI